MGLGAEAQDIGEGYKDYLEEEENQMEDFYEMFGVEDRATFLRMRGIIEGYLERETPEACKSCGYFLEKECNLGLYRRCDNAGLEIVKTGEESHEFREIGGERLIGFKI